MNTLTPSSLPELAEAVRSAPRVLAVGAGTKPRLTAVDAVKISVAGLSGIVEYDPSEFTFTALAGTPVRELAAALAEKGQYLPFDPFLAAAGATLGGTVAAGLSGPGRFRFGGLRDFILGIQFVDARGGCSTWAGKVVKNAAGFDVPKFFVGSLGRFGVLAECTFKVFPRPLSTLTLKLARGRDGRLGPDPDRRRQHPLGTGRGRRAARRRHRPAAGRAGEGAGRDFPRGPGPLPGETLSAEAAQALWSDLREFGWAHPDGPLMKVALTPVLLPTLAQKLGGLPGFRLHASAGGNVAFISLPSADGAARVTEELRALGLSGLTLRGEAPLWLGVTARPGIARAVKDALDPDHRFPLLDD